jgi:hypothetical protein
MTVKQYCEIHNSQVIINLPKQFKNNKKVLVIIDDEVDERVIDKFYLLKKAANDPLFLADIEQVENDFKHIDTENV